MATKAQLFRMQQQRSANPPRPKWPRRPRRDVPVDTSLPGVSASDRKAGQGRTAARNASKSAQRKGGALLEDSATGKPSRKSTRKSTGRLKLTSNLQRQAIRETRSPQSRAVMQK